MTLPLYLLLVSFLVTVLTAGYGLLLRHTGWFTINRVLLWLVIAVAAWLPLADLPAFHPGHLRVMRQTKTILPQALSYRLPGALTHPALPTRLLSHASAAEPMSAGAMLTWLYGLGVVVLTLRFGWQLVVLRRLLRGSSHRNVMGVRLIENPVIRAPFSFFRYVVLNPALYSPDELSLIMQHERLHCRYWHSLDRLASAVLRILLWMNPLVWWHGQLVRENQEYQVDQAVLKAGYDRRAYQYSLLSIGRLHQPAGPVNAFSRPELTNRIRMMNRRQSIGLGVLGLCLFGLIAGALVLTWPTAQHTLIDRPLGRFAVARGNQTYFVIVPTTTADDLRAIQAIARQRKITVKVAPVVVRDRQSRIRQISIGVGPATPAHAPWVSLKAGTPYGQQPIRPLGIRCDPATCTITPVDQTFPFSLRQLARQESETRPADGTARHSDRTSPANRQYGLYETYFLEDMVKGSFFGFRAMLIRIRPDKRLDLYEEARNAVIIWDRQEISRAELQQIRVTDVMKLSVYKGDAAVTRLGDERARPGLLVLSRHPDPAQAEAFAASRYLY